MTQPMLKLTGVLLGIIAAAFVVVAAIPLIAALAAALIIVLPAVLIVMAAWPIIWLARACFGLPWSLDYLKDRFSNLKPKI